MLFTIQHRKHQMLKQRKCNILRKKKCHFELDGIRISQKNKVGAGAFLVLFSTLLSLTVSKHMRTELLHFEEECISHCCLIKLQMFSVGERSGLQAEQFSTWILLIWRHGVVIVAVCGSNIQSFLKKTMSRWRQMLLYIPFSINTVFPVRQCSSPL